MDPQLAMALSSSRKEDILSVIQRHIQQRMEVDRETHLQYQAKVDELNKMRESHANLLAEMKEVRRCIIIYITSVMIIVHCGCNTCNSERICKYA